jgi:HEAT repeat protein
LPKNISKLINDLSDASISKRRKAAEALSNSDARAVYPLLKALKDSNAGVHDAAMRSLVSIGGETTAYMVLPLLREESLLRNTAMIILKDIGYETVPLLRHLLKDKDDDVRKFAIDLLIEINRCDYLDDLASLLNDDKNANVRASAAKALGIFNYKKAVPELIKALNDEEWVCFSALEALSLMKDESTIEPIAQLFKSDSETLRFAAIEAIGRMGFPTGERYLSDHISITYGSEKMATVKSLIQIGVTPTVAGAADLLIDMFINSEWEDRLIALKGLVDMKEQKAIPTVLDIAGSLDSSVPDEMDTLEAVKNLLTGFDCAQSLIRILSDPDAKYRAKTLAINIIESQNCKDAVPYLLKVFEHDLRDIKRASINTLKEFGGEDLDQFFTGALEDSDGHVRKYAAAALGKMGDKSVFSSLLRLLNKEVYADVKEEIVKAMLLIDSDGVISRLNDFDAYTKEMVGKHSMDFNVLNTLIGDDNLNVRLAAIMSLGSVADEQAHQKLLDALKDENADIRKTALLTLAEVGCSSGDILPMLCDSDAWVRIYALKALANSNDPNVIESIAPMLNSGEIPVVLSCIDAISQIATYNGINISGILKPLLNHKVSAIRQRAQESVGNTP